MHILKVIISASIVIMIFEKLNSKYDFFKDIRSKIKNLEEKKERKLLKKEKKFLKELEKPEEERDYGVLDPRLSLEVDILTEEFHNIESFVSQLMKLGIMLVVEREELF